MSLMHFRGLVFRLEMLERLLHICSAQASVECFSLDGVFFKHMSASGTNRSPQHAMQVLYRLRSEYAARDRLGPSNRL